MLDFAWKVFCVTGSVETYLLVKEMENDSGNGGQELMDDMTEDGEVNIPFT